MVVELESEEFPVFQTLSSLKKAVIKMSSRVFSIKMFSETKHRFCRLEEGTE